MNRDNLRTIVRGAYDIQKLRIQMGNRIVGNFKVKMGQEPGKSEDEMDAEAKNILKSLRATYAKIADAVKVFPKRATFKGEGIISDYTELCLVAQYIGLEKHEAQHFGRLKNILGDYPIYTEFLEGVKGVGPAMAGVIVSEIDITRARYASSLWMYAGLNVQSDGLGQSRRKEHLVSIEYKDKDGKAATRMGIRFNPFLKTKLMGVLSGCFLKVVDSPYAVLYRNYKTRMENHVFWGVHNDKKKWSDIPASSKEKAPLGLRDNAKADDKPVSKGRRHNMALRYMVKQFLADLYAKWRELEGLEVQPPYSEAKLGREHVA